MNRDRTTNIKSFIEGNMIFKHIFENQVSGALPTSEYSVNFLVFGENFFQKPLENFVCIVGLRSGYVKCSPSPEECSALKIVTIRQKLRAEIEKVKGNYLLH